MSAFEPRGSSGRSLTQFLYSMKRSGMFITPLDRVPDHCKVTPAPGPSITFPGAQVCPRDGKSSGKREWAKQWWILGEGPGGGGLGGQRSCPLNSPIRLEWPSELKLTSYKIRNKSPSTVFPILFHRLGRRRSAAPFPTKTDHPL